jgi:predicted outer membrane repeat protein
LFALRSQGVFFDSTFSSNIAKSGGAVYVNTDPSATFIQTRFQSNTASTSGGAIYNCGTVTLNIATFSVCV